MNEKYLKTKEGSIEDVAKQMQNKVMENDYQDKFKKALDKEGKPLGHMTGAEKKSFFNKVDKMHKGKNESLDSKDKPTVKDVIGQLKGAVKAHGKQAKDLEKAVKEDISETHTTQTAKANAHQRSAGGEKSPISHMVNKSIKEITANDGKTFAQMRAEMDEACWDSHKQVGTKMKGGKQVPNCVPKNEAVNQDDHGEKTNQDKKDTAMKKTDQKKPFNKLRQETKLVRLGNNGKTDTGQKAAVIDLEPSARPI
jgi:hypothetical protein